MPVKSARGQFALESLIVLAAYLAFVSVLLGASLDLYRAAPQTLALAREKTDALYCDALLKTAFATQTPRATCRGVAPLENGLSIYAQDRAVAVPPPAHYRSPYPVP